MPSLVQRQRHLERLTTLSLFSRFLGSTTVKIHSKEREMKALDICRILKSGLPAALPCEELEVKMQMKLYEGVILTDWEGLCDKVPRNKLCLCST